MGKGKQYELDKVASLTEATNEHVWVTRPDFSGNSRYAFADVALVWPAPERGMCGGQYGVGGAFLELKKRSPGDGKRASDTLKGSKKDQTGLEELRELVEKTPPWGHASVGVKFPHRELIMLNADELLAVLTDSTRHDLEDTPMAPQLTPSNNISVRKPTLDEWASATAGLSDEEKILETHKVPSDYWR